MARCFTPKTAVSDERGARVGSTNLNIASWFSNCELDAIVGNDSFAGEMEEMYLEDLGNSTQRIADAQFRRLTSQMLIPPRAAGEAPGKRLLESFASATRLARRSAIAEYSNRRFAFRSALSRPPREELRLDP